MLQSTRLVRKPGDFAELLCGTGTIVKIDPNQFDNYYVTEAEWLTMISSICVNERIEEIIAYHKTTETGDKPLVLNHGKIGLYIDPQGFGYARYGALVVFP